MTNKTPNAAYEYFKSRCRHWIEVFGLKEWEIYYNHKPVEGGLASYSVGFEGRSADITLSTEWEGCPVTRKQLDKAALHEVLEILLADLAGWANIIIKQPKVQEEKHKIIRRLENFLIKED